jgi:hypothetical protein
MGFRHLETINLRTCEEAAPDAPLQVHISRCLWLRRLLHVFCLYCGAANALDLRKDDALGLRARAQASRNTERLEIRASGETQLRYPLRALGAFLECLLVEQFRAEGFLGPASKEALSADELKRLPELHVQARAQVGDALYALYPWSRFFPAMGLSQQITWESNKAKGGPSLFNPRRAFLSSDDLIVLASALSRSSCRTLRPLGVDYAAEEGLEVFTNEDASFLAWSSSSFYVGSSLGNDTRSSAMSVLKTLAREEGAASP